MPSRRFLSTVVTVGLLLALPACGVGRQPETYRDRPTVDTALASLGDLELRAATIQPPTDGAAELAIGEDATATLAIVNLGEAHDRLVSVTSTIASSVELLGQDGAVAERVDVPRLGALGSEDFQIKLRGLTKALRPGEHAELTFSFTRAGRKTLLVPVGVHTSPVPRPTYDVFEHHEGEGEAADEAEG